MHSTGRVEIDRLRARVREGGDTDIAGLRLGSLFAGADLHPRGVAPSAVLIVRHLADPMPGHFRGASGIDAAWERSVRDELDAMRRGAARPSRGVVMGDADAVLFADEAEMVAALALDLARGRAGDRWWWSVPLRSLRGAGARQLPRLLAERARHLPAVFNYARAWDADLEIARALAPEDALRLLDELCAAHEIESITAPRGTPRETLSAAVGDAAAIDAGRARWERYLRRDAAALPLGDARRLLLGFMDAIDREPAIARSAPFLAALRAWWSERVESEARSAARPDGSRATLHPGAADREADGQGAHGAGDQSAAEPRVKREESEGRSAAPREPGDPASTEEIARHARRFDPVSAGQTVLDHPVAGDPRAEADGTIAGPVAARSTDDRAAEPFPIPRESLPSGGPSPAIARGRESEVPEELDHPSSGEEETAPDALPFPSLDGAYTGLAGIFFLIDLMLYLDLPDAFEREWGLATAVGPWGVLDAIARWLLAVHDLHVTDDPLWEILARLDRREQGTTPGVDLLPASSFHLPVAWLDPAAAGDLHWSADAEALRVWSSHGYPIVESPRSTSDPEIQLRSELAPYAHLLSATELSESAPAPAMPVPAGPLVDGLGEGITGVLARMAPYLFDRLASALGAEPGDRSTIEKMLRRRGRIYATATHIDLVMSQDDIWLPVRLAGLDRDPGWSPRFGRVIQFHFE